MSRKLPESEGKRVPLNMRTTQARRDLLEAQARSEGRSLAQMVERIVDKHFDGLETASGIRTIIREEIEADRERQKQAFLTKAADGFRSGNRVASNNLADLTTQYGRSLSYLNGEPKTDH